MSFYATITGSIPYPAQRALGEALATPRDRPWMSGGNDFP
jgi:hypothetical protein